MEDRFQKYQNYLKSILDSKPIVNEYFKNVEYPEKNWIYKALPLFELYQQFSGRPLQEEKFIEYIRSFIKNCADYISNYDFKYKTYDEFNGNSERFDAVKTESFEVTDKIKLKDFDISFIALREWHTSYNGGLNGLVNHFADPMNYIDSLERHIVDKIPFNVIYDDKYDKYLLGSDYKGRIDSSYFYALILKYFETLDPTFGNIQIDIKSRYLTPKNNDFSEERAKAMLKGFNRVNMIPEIEICLSNNNDYEVNLKGHGNVKGFFHTNYNCHFNKQAFLELEYISKRIGVSSENYNFEFQLDENGNILFLLNGDIVTKNIIDEVITKTCTEKRDILKKKLEELSKLCAENENLKAMYENILGTLGKLSDEVTVYNNSIGSFFKKIRYKKKEFNINSIEKTNITPSEINVDDNSLESLHILINQIKEVTDKINKTLLENNKYNYLISALNNIFIEKKKEYESEVSKNLRQRKSKIEEFDTKSIIVSLESNYEVAPLTKENKKTLDETDKFDLSIAIDFNAKQVSLLNEKEKKALIYYKSLLYRPINQILDTSYRLDGKITPDIDSILESNYQTILQQLNANTLNPFERPLTDKNRRDFDLIAKDISYADFKNLILETIPILLNSINKIGLNDDLLVYRAVTEPTPLSKNIEKGRLISTTTDKEIVSNFFESRYNDGDNFTIYEIVLPKGSPAIMFTSGIWLYDDSKVQAKHTFSDDQKEVLLDPTLFDFKVISIENKGYTNQYDNNRKIMKKVSVVKLIANPKKLIYNDKSIEQDSFVY